MNTEELTQQALRLGPRARADLARVLLASLDGVDEAEIEQLWIDEAMRREDELDRGAAIAHAAAEALERVRLARMSLSSLPRAKTHHGV